MSRVGKKPIAIPNGTSVDVKDKDIKVSGPKGSLTLKLPQEIKATVKENDIIVELTDQGDPSGALWGLYRNLMNNLVIGVNQGYSKQLEINGIGFKAVVQGQKVVLNVGYSHPVNFEIPAGIEVKVEKNLITISGTDKQLVGQVAANIREIKKPEPYQGKGIKYIDEIIRRKAGKAVTAKAE